MQKLQAECHASVHKTQTDCKSQVETLEMQLTAEVEAHVIDVHALKAELVAEAAGRHRAEGEADRFAAYRKEMESTTALLEGKIWASQVSEQEKAAQMQSVQAAVALKEMEGWMGKIAELQKQVG